MGRAVFGSTRINPSHRAITIRSSSSPLEVAVFSDPGSAPLAITRSARGSCCEQERQPIAKISGRTRRVMRPAAFRIWLMQFVMRNA